MQVDGRPRGLGQRGGGALQLAGEVLRLAVEVEAQAENQLTDLVGIDPGLGEYAAGLAAADQEVVGPFQARLDLAEIRDEFADVEPHPEGEVVHAGRLELRPEHERRVEIAGGGAVPIAAAAAPALGLGAGQDHQRHPAAGGQVALRFAVGAVDLVQADDLGRAGPAAEVGVDQGRMQQWRCFSQLVAAAADGLESETLLRELLQLQPHRHPRDPERPRQTRSRDVAILGRQQFAQDGDFGLGH